MKAIKVTYLGLDEDRKLILDARNRDGSYLALYDWEEDIGIYMRSTAMDLAKKLNYKGVWIGDQLPCGDYAFICIDAEADLVMGVRQ